MNIKRNIIFSPNARWEERRAYRSLDMAIRVQITIREEYFLLDFY